MEELAQALIASTLQQDTDGPVLEYLARVALGVEDPADAEGVGELATALEGLGLEQLGDTHGMAAGIITQLHAAAQGTGSSVPGSGTAAQAPRPQQCGPEAAAQAAAPGKGLRAAAAEFVPKTFALQPPPLQASTLGPGELGPAAAAAAEPADVNTAGSAQHEDDTLWEQEHDDACYEYANDESAYEDVDCWDEAGCYDWRDQQEAGRDAESAYAWQAYMDPISSEGAHDELAGAAHESRYSPMSQLRGADAVELLQMWFPHYGADALQQLYQACGQDMEVCFRELLLMEAEEVGSSMELTTPTTAIPAFRYEGPQQQQPQQQQQQQLPVPDLQTDFPALSGASPPAAGAGQHSKAQAPTPLISSSWAQQLKQNSGVVNGTSSLAGSRAAGGSSGSRHPAVRTSAAAGASQRAAAAPAIRCGGSSGFPAWLSVPRVETGAALSRQYAEARGEARDFARLRNACFQQATLAYLAGNKALAKQLSAQGREHAAAMAAAHERAAASILATRNSSGTTRGGAHTSGRPAMPSMRAASGGPMFLDLHGLHVKEAQQLLRQQLGQLRAGQVLRLCVGVGKHSSHAPVARGMTGRLLPAVHEVLQSEGWACGTIAPGLLEVRRTAPK
eukprot:CAMPEP_0202896984 /NCGR_PEP_ID=MMETSP1392-20130828/5868_1 /ASSEMBLY_ACC=CAM_ASM_000868 /TAXON_ID=225041 /ORGANISM="Chlamydomonas chlamydogama, Strain SAG 11-48b" /LENGTH=619 /DNA_ID=CAMNT_0049582517 /DNA_START=266 /DNA_END=2125 /DNA_ORIENTATION=-